MLRLFLAAACSFGLGCSGIALAQTSGAMGSGGMSRDSMSSPAMGSGKMNAPVHSNVMSADAMKPVAKHDAMSSGGGSMSHNSMSSSSQ